MTGHLSHHIEHHLFPDIPAYRYPEMSREVKKICARYDIPYLTGPFTDQFLTVWKRILKFSLPNAKDEHGRRSFDMSTLFEPSQTEQGSLKKANLISQKMPEIDFEAGAYSANPEDEVDIVFSESNRKIKASSANSILFTAESIGLKPNFGCRKGVCRTCTVTKRSGRVLDNNTGIESGDGREQIKICVSSPLTSLCLEL